MTHYELQRPAEIRLDGGRLAGFRVVRTHERQGPRRVSRLDFAVEVERLRDEVILPMLRRQAADLRDAVLSAYERDGTRGADAAESRRQATLDLIELVQTPAWLNDQIEHVLGAR